jgi:hypothetical protein
MELVRAREIIDANALDDSGSFYGSPAEMSLGLGLLIDNVEFPIFNEETNRFSVQAGLVYILSHECDLDPANSRFLNGIALVSPILQLEAVLKDADARGVPEGDLRAFLGNVATRKIARCVYLPPLADKIPNGGLLNLNLLASTSVGRLEAGERVAAITVPALYTIQEALSEHLLREKSETLPLAGVPWRRSRSIRG